MEFNQSPKLSQPGPTVEGPIALVEAKAVRQPTGDCVQHYSWFEQLC